MAKGLKIESYCIIRNNTVILNGNLVFDNKEAENLKDFTKSIYRSIKPSYNKFFKMDEISKLGFLASEFLLKDVELEQYEKEDVSIILSNSDSTLITDENHQKSISDIKNFFPSPSIFVYTLPNIMIGEISIRHGLQGENSFFIVEKFNLDIVASHVNNLFLTHKLKAAIGGWVNHSETGYDAFLYFASQLGDIGHNVNEIKKLYNINR